MYTKEFVPGSGEVDAKSWSVLDPDGDELVGGIYEGEADSLVSHLNRGMK